MIALVVSLSQYMFLTKNIVKRLVAAKVNSLKMLKSIRNSAELILFLGLSTKLKHCVFLESDPGIR
jgi:hypothetical protein